MSVPDFQSLMLPILRELHDGSTRAASHMCEAVATTLKLTEADLEQMQAGSRQTTFYNRSRWALSYLFRAGLIARPERAHYRITERGLEALAKVPDRLTLKYFQQFPEYQAFTETSSEKDTGAVQHGTADSTPSELVQNGYEILRAELAASILEQVAACSPAFFEQLVVDLLVAMGYGGTRTDAGSAVGQSGDEGIDGIIKQDHLGLDAIYIQAKRWSNVVGRPVVQGFAGALDGKKARRGVLITTSGFTKEAWEYAAQVEKSIVLVDGPTLAGLMIDYGVGVTDVDSYTIKRLDVDYFESTDL